MGELIRGTTHIAYTDRGTGHPLVLVHGAASSQRSFGDVLPDLARTARIITVDLRGMGASSRVVTLGPTDWDDDLLALLDHLGIERADLGGTSLGARIVTRVALDRPERVRGLVLDAPMIYASPEGDEAVERVFGPHRSEEMRLLLRRWHGADWESVAQTYLTLRHSAGLQERYDFRDGRLASLSTPSLITRGDLDDPIHPVAHAVQFHRTVPKSSLWIAPDTAFSVARYRPAEWASAISHFLANLP